MQIKKLLTLVTVVCFTITACSANLFTAPTLTPILISPSTGTDATTNSPNPIETLAESTTELPLEIVNHEKPNIQTDFSPFQNIGCDKPYKRENQYHCEEDSQLLNAGCNTITNLPLLGGLSPNYPIALCTLEINQEFAFVELPPNECLYTDGFMTTFCNRYIIYKEGEFQLIKSVKEFRAFFAPVDTPNEALAFVLAEDGRFTAQYNQTRQDNLTYLVTELEDTYVKSIDGGYIVHVFFMPLFGCAMFETESAEVKINYRGETEEVNYAPAYQIKETICKE